MTQDRVHMQQEDLPRPVAAETREQGCGWAPEHSVQGDAGAGAAGVQD